MPVSPGHNVDLLYDRPAALDADLIFGAGYVPPRNDVVVQATLPLPVASVVFIPPARLELLAALPGLTVSTLILRPSVPLHVGVASLPGVVLAGEVRYASRTQRPTVGQTAHEWQQAAQTEEGATQGQQDAAATPAGWGAVWQRAERSMHGIAHRLPPVLVAAPLQRRTGQQQATRLHGATGFLHEGATPIAQIRTGVFQNATSLRDATRFAHQDGDRAKRAGRSALWENARLLTQRQSTDFQIASRRPVGWRGRYQDAMRPPPGISVWIVPEPPEPPRCYTPNGHLLFTAQAPASAHLLFFCENHTDPPDGEPVVVPVRRVYIVLNNITLHRVDTGAELRAHSFGMSLDYQSWTWSWQATLHNDADAHLGRDSQGDPAELAVMVNGQQFRLRLERVTRDRRFNPTRWSVSGKGKASILSAPYAPAMPFGNPSAARTAQQLMQDALTINGVGIGWSVDWGLQDWLVPAGAWAMQGSYIDAINDIAAAAGGYVQPHPTDSVLRILPRYPAAPWDWGSISPDFEIPADAAEVEGTEYIDQPAYNRVFVGGVGAGVFGPFTRAGTAGDVIAPQVTHALITDAVVHRQRGVAELSNTGRQEHVTLNMQVLPETGVIVPGKFVRYLGDRPVMGIVRSTSIDWSFPKLRQTIKLETHA